MVRASSPAGPRSNGCWWRRLTENRPKGEDAMLDAIKYHFRHLTDFSGRDARQTFWYWMLFLFLINMAVSIAATVPMMVDMMSSAFAAAERGDDPVAAQQVALAQMAGSMQ